MSFVHRFDKVPILLIMILGACVWYLLFKDTGDYTHNKAITQIFIVFFLYFVGEAVFWNARYHMPQVTVNGLSGSFNHRPVVVGDYAIYSLGETIKPVYVSGKLSGEPTLIVPVAHIKRAGKYHVGLTFVKITPLLNLPKHVFKYLFAHQRDFNIDDIYFGKYTEEFTQNHIDELPDIESLTENFNRQINERDQIIEGNDDIILEKVKFAREVTKEKKPILNVFKRKDSADQETGG